jgi:uncharacterized protein (TIGR03437 family)
VQLQITKACQHLYHGGPYRKDETVNGLPGRRWRSFWYFYHGGTTVNPTRYENGGASYTAADQGWIVKSERQGISTIFSAYGYAYVMTGDSTFKAMGDELYESAFGDLTDGIHNEADGSAKNYNQNYRSGGRYLAWRLGGGTPVPSTPPIVSVTSPTNGQNLVAGTDIVITSAATDADGSVAKVEFYANGELVGTDYTSPFAITWPTVAAGSYTLTAKATNSQGLWTISNGVSVSALNLPTSVSSVSRAKNHANFLAGEVSSNGMIGADGAENNSSSSAEQLASDLDALTQDIQQALADFIPQQSLFPAAATINTQLTGALLFNRANSALALKLGQSMSVRNHLLRVAAHLAVAEDLMVYSSIQSATVAFAQSVNARIDLTIGNAETGYEVPSATGVAPLSLASAFSSTGQPPLSTQVLFAALPPNNALPYEVGGVNVTVNGKSMPVIFVSPARVIFHLSSEVTAGPAQILITTQDGHVSSGSTIVSPNLFRVMTSAETGDGPAIAINGVLETGGNFNVITQENFGPDKRTRVRLFATGINGSAVNSNPANDVLLNGVWLPNLAESVVVEVRLSDNRVISLPVEFAGSAGTLPGLDQVQIILTPEVEGAGTVQLFVVIGGQRSNTSTIGIK